MVLCDKHGLQYLGFTSPNLQQHSLKNTFFETKKIKKITIIYVGDEIEIVLDEDFLEKYQLTINDKPDVENDKYDAFFQELAIVCPICFYKYLKEIEYEDYIIYLNNDGRMS